MAIAGAILTCWHVANAEGSFEITTVDGEVDQATHAAQSLCCRFTLLDPDLAILQFTSTTSHQVAAAARKY